MIRTVLFLLTVLSLSTSLAQNACFDLFDKQTTLSAFTEMRADFEPGDLREAGHLINGKDHQGLEDVLKMIALREGTYPILIDNQNNIMIDHRLPNPDVGVNENFLGTHRGLYARLQKILGEKPQVVFAGQIRVIGGVPVNLVDQAGTFFQRIEDFKNFGDLALDKLIEANQKRLNFASQYLLELGLINSSTTIMNFRERFKNYASGLINQGHTTARQAALFERRCRKTPACFAKVQIIDKYVRWVMQNGGEKYLLQLMPKLLKRDETRAEVAQVFMMLSPIINEGIIDTLATIDIITYPDSPSAQHLNYFIENLPTYFPEVP